MRTGVPGHAHARPWTAATTSHLRSASRESRGSLGALQTVIFDGYPYYVTKHPDAEDEEVWFDALTGAQIAGPHE
ncbi:hypothetical protein AB0O47_38855 [Streptomyces noursei]|uniref:hypothetical protein n=1 Tax=Streptomyces noursei TaxID=1971 RepID=UPI00344B8571